MPGWRRVDFLSDETPKIRRPRDVYGRERILSKMALST
jgi:hypothetical protein